VAPKTVEFIAYFVVSGAGSGTDTLQITTPTNPSRAVRQFAEATFDQAAAPSLRSGQLVSFTGGTGATWDRLRWDTGSGTNSLENMSGQNLVASMVITISGRYMEA
jgi:hypothetical protein